MAFIKSIFSRKRATIDDILRIKKSIESRLTVPTGSVEGEEILVPTFEIAANPTINLSEIRARRFYVVDRARQEVVRDIQNEI